MIALVRTKTCKDCREIVDVMVGTHGRMGPSGDPELDKHLDRCPNCRGTKLTVWRSPRPCPRCRTGMKRGELVMLWD
jgi:hypothetical protein